MAECDHPDFEAHVECSRLEDSPVWYADLKLRCTKCDQQMQFIGFPMGLSPGEPMTNVSGTELRIPFRAYSEEEARRRFPAYEPAGFTVKRSILGEETHG